MSFSQAWGTIPMRMGWAGMWVGSVQQGRGMVGMYTISRRHYGFRHVVCIETRHYLGFMESNRIFPMQQKPRRVRPGQG